MASLANVSTYPEDYAALVPTRVSGVQKSWKNTVKCEFLFGTDVCIFMQALEDSGLLYSGNSKPKNQVEILVKGSITEVFEGQLCLLGRRNVAVQIVFPEAQPEKDRDKLITGVVDTMKSISVVASRQLDGALRPAAVQSARLNLKEFAT